MSIEAVVFDLGGVLIRTQDPEPRAQLARQLGVSVERLVDLVLEGPRGREAQLGFLHPRELWAWVAQQVGHPEADPDALNRAFWAGDRWDFTLIDYLRQLREHGYRVGLLSNAWITLREWLETETPLAGLFDAMVISAEVHWMKPDPRIYARILGELAVLPEHAVFIDDRPENVEGARRVGMHAIPFTTTAEVLARLQALGLPAPAAR